MNTPPELFDRAALARNRARATAPDGMFLQNHAADEIEERLELVNRSFTDIAVVTPYPELWRQRMPAARIVPDAEVLDLPVGGFDLVVHALCLHWTNDPVGQLIQARRALRPDGLFMATLFGGRTLAELRAALTAAEAQLTGGLAPRVAPMGDIRDLGGLLQRAGFALPVADSLTLTVSYAGLYDLMRDLRAMGETNALADRRRAAPHRRLFDVAERLYPGPNSDKNARLSATFEIICLTGWAPHASQQTPLRPGSAKARLAAALGTDERPAHIPGDGED